MEINKLLSIGFTIVILALFVLSIYYTSNRLRVYFGLKSICCRFICVTLTVIGTMTAMMLAARSSSAFVGALSIIGGYILIFYIYVFVLFALIHVISLKWNLPLRWCAAGTVAFAFMLTMAGSFRANSFAVNEIRIKLPKLTKEISVMLISDVHLGWHRGREYLEKIVNETNLIKPDIILIAGDIADSNVALNPDTFEPLAKFIAPVYFVIGNHETYIDTKLALELIERYGVHILHNKIVYENGVQIVGLDYMNADENTFDMHLSNDTRTIKSILANLTLKSNMPTLLMHHSPIGIKYVKSKGIDLMLSGHTHAGQVFPFTLLVNIIFPFNRGLYQEDKMQVFVTQGAGTYMVRSRLGSSNEINLLRLMPN
ncbi:MAG: metallophosphoesterase [Campylobacteraceae bacterium]|jgi:predicted MPP superfamily phosphohydrolase|nr:metallophosphoesterase [Campylobacteraceae bacterium]